MPDITQVYQPTRRQRCIERIISNIATMPDPFDNSQAMFLAVTKGELRGGDAGAATGLPAAAVDEGVEEETGFISLWTEKTLEVFIQFRFENKLDVDAYTAFNYYLGVLLKHLTKDYHLGEQAINFTMESNQAEVDSGDDPTPGGTIKMRMVYRHPTYDPFG